MSAAKPHTSRITPKPDNTAECRELCVDVWNFTHHPYFSGRAYIFCLKDCLESAASALAMDNHPVIARRLTSALAGAEYLSSFVTSRTMPPLHPHSSLPRYNGKLPDA